MKTHRASRTLSLRALSPDLRHKLWLKLCGSITMVVAMAAMAHGSIAITEIVGNPNGSDTNREWVELFNYGPDPVNLTGWRFATDSGSAVNLPAVVMPSGGYLILADDKTTFQNEWLGSADVRVYTAATAFDIDNGAGDGTGNSDYPRVTSPIDNDVAWYVVLNGSVNGNSTYLAENTFTDFRHGSWTDSSTYTPINVNGNDPAGTIGYESTNNTSPAGLVISTNNDHGTPLAGGYTAAPHTVVSITSPSIAYTQNFDTLGSSNGASSDALVGSSPLPSGWRTFEAQGGFNSSYRADDGNSGNGDVLSLGADADSDRALGSLRTGGDFGMYFGAVFRNDTGQDIVSIEISYIGELWRIGADHGGPDVLDFAYSTDAINLYDGTYIDVDALDFLSPVTGDAQALDGNLAQNQTAIGTVIITFAAPIAAGQEFWIRWFDRNASGSDDSMGIDNLVVNFNAATSIPTPAALPAGLGLMVLLATRRRR